MKTTSNYFLLLFWIVISSSTVLFHGCKEQKPLVPDPGVVSWTFRNQLSEDVPGTLDMIKEMGITNMEFSGLFGETPQSLRELLDEREMKCTSYGVSYDALVNDTQKVAEDALILGADYVRIAWIPHDGDFTIDHARKAVEDFNKAGKILHENGLFFCYHNHGYEFRPFQDATLFDYIVENTNPDWVSFELDILWVQHPGADPVELLKKYPQRFRLMHLKDLKKGVKGDFSGSTPRENDVVLGTGQIDIPGVLLAAQSTNIEHYYIEDESVDVISRVPQSLEYIKSIK
ncbi:MAG: sugar phosphate isomerase/epimerase family protein [Bacteroidota bacterium]